MLSQQQKIPSLQRQQTPDADNLYNLLKERLNLNKKTGCSLVTNDAFTSANASPRQCTGRPSPFALRDSFQSEETQCKSCQFWRKWAMLHQRQMLQLQNCLIQKQARLSKIMHEQKNQLTVRKMRAEELESILKQSQIKIEKLQEDIKDLTKKCQEAEARNIACQTPKKIEIIIENEPIPKKIHSLELNSIEKTEKFQNLVKTSAITTKTEGWGCELTLKKEKIQNHSAFTKRTDLQRCLFENQTLRDYNLTLLDRLASARYKKSIY